MNKIQASFKKRLEQGEGGFTLIELLVVMLIIGILLAIAIPTFLSVVGNAHNTAAQSNLGNEIIEAQGVYTNDQGEYGQSVGSMVSELQKADPSYAVQAIPATITPNKNDSTIDVGVYDCTNGTTQVYTIDTNAGDTNCQGIVLAAWEAPQNTCFYLTALKAQVASTAITSIIGAPITAQGTYYGFDHFTNGSSTVGCGANDKLSSNGGKWNANSFPPFS